MKIINEFEINNDFGCNNYVARSNSTFRSFCFKKGEQIKIELIEENSIFLISEGTLQVEDCNHQSKILHSGQMFLRTKDSGNLEGKATEDLTLTCIQFNNILSTCEKTALDKISIYCPAKVDEFEILEINEAMSLYINGISLLFKSGAFCNFMYELKKRELIFILYTFYDKVNTARFLLPLIENQNNFISLVLNKFTINCNVIELANRCNMSPKTLTRKFKEHFNDTPYQWIIQQKNKNILSRLAQPNVNIQSISEEFGFSSSAHFISYCKRYLKQTPLVIHKEIRNKEV
ncbi:hypothetical protein A9168_02645 [Macellibacteroides sp. HH-ZS]|nr:hypothetical protein A9168_02645 [Macellibacteroides sp. HH-ZS]